MGISALFFAPMGNAFISMVGPSNAFRLCGIVFVSFFLVFSWLVKSPKPGWLPEGWESEPNGRGVVRSSLAEMSTPQMLGTPVFWVVWVAFVASSTSGMMVIAHASDIGQDLVGITASQGALMVGILAVGNFSGRFAFGAMSDKVGRWTTLVIILILSGCDMVFLMGNATTFVLFVVAVVIAGACFGGIMSVLPSLCADLFGNVNFGQNYAAMYSGYTAAAFVGPLLAATIVAHTGAYNLAFLVAGALAFVAIILVFIARALASRLMG